MAPVSEPVAPPILPGQFAGKRSCSMIGAGCGKPFFGYYRFRKITCWYETPGIGATRNRCWTAQEQLKQKTEP